jgi:ATF/CREB family transcription factor
MLTGPQHHLSHLNHFDPSTFRTGFTPDLSNFKTGLTPLGSASGFPPPSPGTAAFLAMVNGNGPQMTPNTFTALTNHASSLMNSGEHTGITPMQSDVRSGQNGSQNQGDFDLAFGRQHQHQQQAGGAANARQKAGVKAAAVNGTTSDTPQQAANKPGQPKLQSNGQTQGGGPQGAAGLFLLSQAHQELSKRDQQQAGQGQGGQVQQPNGMVQAPQPQPPASFTGQQGASAPAANGNASKGTKRKKSSATANASSSGNEGASGSGGKAASSAGPAAAGAPAKTAKKAKRGAKSESVDDEIGGSDGESGDESKFDGEGGSPGDDEEKRKNFLERNRQAALKCRQRKKAWLQDLQTKVAFYEAENGGLQETVGALRNEVMFLKSQLMQLSQHQHQQAGGMPLMPPGMLGPHSQQGGPGVHPQQYGPPQGARGPSQGASYSPASQAA